MSIRRYAAFLGLTLGGLLSQTVGARGQVLTLFDLDTNSFPTMSTSFYAFDGSGNQISPAQSDVSIAENGTPRNILSISCPPFPSPRAISSVLTVDVSGSMAATFAGPPNIDLARAAARAWVNALPLGTSECAVTSFDHLNYLNQDFTIDASRLLGAIDGLTPAGGTDYDMGLLRPLAGGLQISREGKHQKVIVFLTDGLPQLIPDVDAIVAEAQAQNCIIFAVTLYMPCPPALREIADRTGGTWHENVTSVSEAEEVYRTILYQAQSGAPCTITWEGLPCEPTLRTAEMTWSGLSDARPYEISVDRTSHLEFSPGALYYRSPEPLVKHDSVVRVTARNDAFSVTNITATNPAFDITPKAFTLARDQSIDLTVSYTPTDRNYAWTAFTLETGTCPQRYFASGGWAGGSVSGPTLRVDHPNGGEVFPILSDTVITWSGIPETDSVRIEYTTNLGANWIELASRVTGGSWDWHVPATPSNTCLVRITRLDPSGLDESGVVRRINVPGVELYTVGWSTDGKYVAIGGGGANPTVRSVADGSIVSTLNAGGLGIASLAWSPDGSRIATANFNGRAEISDAMTGASVQTLSGHGGSLVSVDWSPDGSKLVTGAIDQRAIIWDALTGALLFSLAGHVGQVTSVAWSPDGNLVATTADDGKVNLWNPTTGGLVRTIQLPNGAGNQLAEWRVAWSPDGSWLVASGGLNTIARVYNPATGAEIHALTGHTNTVFTISVSPDGTLIATGAADGRAMIWDASTGALLQQLGGLSEVILDVAWSPDGSMIVGGGGNPISGAGADLMVWEAVTGREIKRYVGHSDLIWNVEWSPNGAELRIASVAVDGVAYIWGLPDGPFMQDRSDAVFRIVSPRVTALDVDMGKVVVGGRRDSVVTAMITNPDPWPVRIDSMRIQGGSASLFSIISGMPPREIPANGSIAVEFGFRPTAVGTRSAQLLIYSRSQTLLQAIEGEGVAPEVQLAGSMIDFGDVTVGEERDSIQAMTVMNVGTVPVMITRAEIAGPNDLDFSILNPAGAQPLGSGATARIDLRFIPSVEGRTNGSLLVHHDGPGSPSVIQLFGRGIAPVPVFASATLATDDYAGMPGETLDIPIRLRNGTNVEASGTTRFTALLRFDATLLEPVGTTPTGTIVGDDRVIELDLPSSAGADGILATYSFRVGLGRDSITTLMLEDPRSVDGDVDMSVEVGIFRLLGICYAGGARLINPNGSVALKLAGANGVPTGGIAIELETVEIGRTNLELFDAGGRPVRRFIDGEITPGRRLVQLDVSDLPSGVYFLVLQTPTERRSVAVEVVR